MISLKKALPTFLLLATPVQASLLFGTVNFNGNTTISMGLVHFIDPLGNPTGLVTITSSTGDFATQAGLLGVAKDISSAAFPIPPGTGVLLNSFSILSIPNVHFNMTFLFDGVQGTSGCAAGVNCSPANTPFNLTNTSPFTSTASFAVSGYEIDDLTGLSTPYVGVFTAQFGQTLQQVLAAFASNGGLTTSFSGTIAVPNAVPEISGGAMAIISLLTLSLSKIRRKFKDDPDSATPHES